jgi:hypothetical protein
VPTEGTWRVVVQFVGQIGHLVAGEFVTVATDPVVVYSFSLICL